MTLQASMSARRARIVLLGALLFTTLAAGALASRRPTGGVDESPGAAVSGARGAVSLRAGLDRGAVLRGGDGLVHAELVLEGRSNGDASASLPTDFVVVLDRSGSMSGTPIEFAKAAVRELYAGLRPQDRFALVAYSNDAAIELPLAPAGTGSQSNVERALENVVASGGTNLSAGLDLAHEIVAGARASGRAQRVILLSDGHANEGDFSAEGLRARAARAVPSEYVLSAVGVGPGFDEQLMSALADAGTGNFYYLPDLRELAGTFAGEFAAARETVARGLVVEIAPGPGIELVDAAGYPLERAGSRLLFRPGDLYAGQVRRVFLTLRAPTDREADLEIGALSLRWQDPDGSSGELPPLTLPSLACVAGEDAYYASFDDAIYRRSSQEALGALKEKVAASLGAGRQDEAVRELDLFSSRYQAEQKRALGAVDPGVASMLDSLGATASAPAAAKPEVQQQLGKQWLEEGRDARRVGAKH
jgi:Ca-activated chloride channel homolog